jgi:hypothetical protein
MKPNRVNDETKRTEITHFRDFERVDVKNGINGASVGRDTLHRTKFSGLILSAGGRRGAGEACVDAANSVGERGASELEKSVMTWGDGNRESVEEGREGGGGRDVPEVRRR